MARVGVTDPEVGFEVVRVDGLGFVPNNPADEGMEGACASRQGCAPYGRFRRAG